jgi:hypothetical protein
MGPGHLCLRGTSPPLPGPLASPRTYRIPADPRLGEDA